MPNRKKEVKMKKKSLTFLLCLIASLTALAQSGWISTTRLPGDIRETIVRRYQADYSISHIQTTKGHYFAWSDNQTSIILVGIDSSYKVTDFEISGDIVCFCGAYDYGPNMYGFVGWFSIPHLFGGTDNYHIFSTSFLTLIQSPDIYTHSHVTAFNDLTIFENIEDQLGRVHIALVGRDAKWRPCVAELKGFFGTSNWAYTTGASDVSDGTLDQIVATDNYIVAAGAMPDGMSMPLRIFHKTAMFTSYPILGDIMHRYLASSSQPCSYPTNNYNGFKMTHTNGDTVATLSLFYDASYLNSDGFVTHIINASGTAYDPDGSPCASSRIEYNPYGSYAVNRLTYSNTNNILRGLAWSNNPLTGTTSMMGEQAYPFIASKDYFSRIGYYFYHHDNFFSPSGYIAFGRNESTLSELAIIARHLSSTNNSVCGVGISVPTIDGAFYLKNNKSPLTCYSDIFSFDDHVPLSIYELPLIKDCIEN